MKNLEEIVSKNLGWLQTTKQRGGYAGPVVHYWRDSLNYIGPGIDWRYEGLLSAFVTLFKKTEDKYFLDLAIEAGNHILASQLKTGNFFNSNFESNPSLRGGAMPHEPAACIGLLTLAEKLRELNMNWKAYFIAAKKNVDRYIVGTLWDEKSGTFFQYRYDRKTLVPNKIATITECMLLLYHLTKEKRYLLYAIKNADFIISMQDNEDGEFYGGIYQSSERKMIITFYVARCVPALIEVFKIVGDDKYIESALRALSFIKKMETRDGGFYFGYAETGEEPELYRYPIWIAGSGDIIRAFLSVKRYKKFHIRKNLKWILANMDDNGGIRTSYGMNLKNKPVRYNGESSWRDVLHVVGWNDKSLRLLAELIEKDAEIPIRDSPSITVNCSDGIYYEDEKVIRIEGEEDYVFNKKAMFSKHDFIKRNLMRIGRYYTKFRYESYGLERILYLKLK